MQMRILDQQLSGLPDAATIVGRVHNVAGGTLRVFSGTINRASQERSLHDTAAIAFRLLGADSGGQRD